MKRKEPLLDLCLKKLCANLAPGQPLDELQQVLAPMYLLHRYQVEAAAKLIGGVNYRYVVNGEPVVNEPVSATEQRRALAALLVTLNNQFLALPTELEKLLVPKAYGSATSREDFPTRMGLFTDPLTMAETSANHTLNFMLNPQRLNRLSWQFESQNAHLAPFELAQQLIDNSQRNLAENNNQISQRVAYLTAYHLSQSMLSESTAPEVKSQLEWALIQWHEQLTNAASANEGGNESTEEAYALSAFPSYLARRIEHFLANGEWPDAFTPAQMPPGSPI